MQFLALAAAMFATATPAAATPPSCAAPEFRQMDFWVGNWSLKWQGGEGVNHITRSYDGCVVEEHFDGQPSAHLQGHSISIYSSGAWRQNWVDNQGGYFDLTGGPQADGSFILENVRLDAATPYRRMVFENIKPDSLTWHWQSSTDSGKTWQDSWVIEYTRMKS